MAARDSAFTVGRTGLGRSAHSTSTSARIARGHTPHPVRTVGSGSGGSTRALRGMADRDSHRFHVDRWRGSRASLSYVKVAVVDTVTRSLTGQPAIWNSS